MADEITREQELMEPLIDGMRALHEQTHDFLDHLRHEEYAEAAHEMTLAQAGLDEFERHLGFAAQELGYDF